MGLVGPAANEEPTEGEGEHLFEGVSTGPKEHGAVSEVAAAPAPRVTSLQATHGV